MDWQRWIFFWRRDDKPGVRGERLAASHLRQQGIRILAKNVRCGKGELDLVALDGDTLVFVEVRSRGSEDYMTPEASVRWKKRQSLRKAARWFVKARRLKGMQTRFDMVAVVGEIGKEEIRHHKGAFGWSE